MTKQDQHVAGYYAGDTLELDVTVEDEDGNAVDISGASIEWALIDPYPSSSLVTKSTSGGGVTVTNAAGGEFRVDIDPTDTQSLDAGTYRHEAELTDSSSKTTTLFVGRFELNDSQI